jgi:hypothetical protein
MQLKTFETAKLARKDSNYRERLTKEIVRSVCMKLRGLRAHAKLRLCWTMTAPNSGKG